MDPTKKSSVDEIRARFDHDVERFSNLQTGQSATMDAVLALDLISQSAAQVTPAAKKLIDVGCGAGNFSLKFLETVPDLDVKLIDLSRPMLARARERVSPETQGIVTVEEGDIRELDLGRETTDFIVAAAVLHHLRTEDEWDAVFRKFFEALTPGGSLWIFDLVKNENDAVEGIMQTRYGEYLVGLRDEVYRDQVFEYIAKEDTPQTVSFQLASLKGAGFRQVDVLHKNVCFAALYAVK